MKNIKQQLTAKMLNAAIMGDKFENKSLDDYIYASLSQPPIKIIDKNGSDDELDFTVECPNCGNHINYGEHTYMLSGHIYCDTKGCREKLCYLLERRDKNENKQ